MPSRAGICGIFKEELGDLLLQVVVQARIAEERGDFDFGGVVEASAREYAGFQGGIGRSPPPGCCHIAEGRGDFDFGGVVEAIAQKMIGVIRMCLPRRVIVHRFARRPSRRCSARPARLDLRLERCQMGARENSPLKSKSRSMPGHLPPSRRKSAMCFSPPRAK
jgi:hypothetical protein